MLSWSGPLHAIDLLVAFVAIVGGIGLLSLCVRGALALWRAWAPNGVSPARHGGGEPITIAKPCFNHGCHRRAVATLQVGFFGGDQERRYYCALHLDPAFSALLVADHVKSCHKLDWVAPR